MLVAPFCGVALVASVGSSCNLDPVHRAYRELWDAGITVDIVAPGADLSAIHDAQRALSGAIVALQFQDMATQLIAHTTKRLRNCADRLARDAMADDEDGEAVVEDAPLCPNPVTQDEMDAGSVELF